MLYLYLDESGDLGFDFVNKKPSSFFTVCVLAVRGRDNDRALAKSVKDVIRRKLPKNTSLPELKGNTLPQALKEYFFQKAGAADFGIYSATLNKISIYKGFAPEKDRIYNYMANLALASVDLEDAAVRVVMTVDKSKQHKGIAEFNAYILNQIKARLHPLVPLDIVHVLSQESCGLQAADMFAWGIFRKYEKGDCAWYDVFKSRLRADRLYYHKKEEGRAA